ncbi:Protein white, partial [Bienertia sinuspersici]
NAVVQTSGDKDYFYGAVGRVSVFKPVVHGNQWSVARMKLINEGDFIEAGWMVNPSLYKDSEAHFYARFNHEDDGNWWLSIDSDNKLVGYWPNTLFVRSLDEVASQVEWGGEIDNPESDHTPPPYMGSGLSPRDDTKFSAFYCQIQVATSPSIYEHNPMPTKIYQECDSDGYRTSDVGYQGDFWGRLIFFGGPFA